MTIEDGFCNKKIYGTSKKIDSGFHDKRNPESGKLLKHFIC